MAIIPSDLARSLDARPSARHDVVVTASGSLEALLAAVPAGMEVRHVYRLRKGIAASADAASVRALASSGAVESIEPDRPVSAAGTPPTPGTRQ